MMITANPTRSQLWIEPTGKVHEFDDVTHGKWAMDKLGMAYHPELEEDADGFTKEIPEGWMDTFEVEQEAQSQLLKAGWIRMGFFRRGHAAVVYIQKDSPLTPAELGRAQTWIMQHPEWQGPAIDVQDPKLWTVPMADFLAAKKTTEFRGLKTAAGPIPLDTKLIDRVFRAIVSNIKGYWGNYDAPIGERELSIAFSLSATPTNVSGEERQGLNVKLVFEDAYLSKAVRGAEVYPGKWPTLVVYLSGKLTGQDITKRLEGLEGFYLRGILVHELAHVFDHIPDEALGVSPKDNAEAYYNLDTEVSAYATQLWHYIVTNADYYRKGGAEWLKKTGEKGLWSLVDSALTLRIGNGIRRYCNEANRRYILQVAYRAMQEVLESPESKAASLKLAQDAGITKADLQRIRPILREWVGGGWTDGPQLMRLLEKHKDILAKFRMSKPVRLWRNERAQILTRGGQDVTGPSNAGWEDQYTRPSAWSATRMHAESYASGNGRRLVTAIVPPEDTYCYIPLVEQAARALGMKTFDPHQQDEVIVRPNPSFLDQIRPKVTVGEEAQLRRDYELAMVEYHLPQLHELRKTNPKAISDEELKRRIADIAKHKEIHDVRDELAKLRQGKAARKNASLIAAHFDEKQALSRTRYRAMTAAQARVYQPKRVYEEDVLVTLDVAKVEASWRKDGTFYVAPGGANQLRGRYDRFAQWLQDNPGVAIEPPDIGLTPSGEIIFGNGRHRFAVLRDQGAQRIAATVPRQDLKAMVERFGAQPINGTSVTASDSVRTLVSRAQQLTKEDPLYEALGMYECGAFDGGCHICADALILAAGRGELVRLVTDTGRTDHYGAKIDGLYCDFSGCYATGDQWAKTLARLEHVTVPLHVEEGMDPRSGDENEPPRDLEVSKEIAALLRGPATRTAKTLFHGTSAERARGIEQHGLQPQVGELTSTAYEDDAESVGEELEPLAFAGDKEALQRGVYSAMLHAIEAEGHDISDPEQAIRNWGALVILKDGDEAMEHRPAEDDPYGYTDHPLQVEPGDFYSRDNVAIDYILTGPTLVRYLKRHGVNMERWTRPFSEQKRNALVGMVRRAHPDVPVEKIVEKVNALTFEQFHKSWDYYTKLERSRVAKLASKNQVPAEGENVTPWDLAHIAVAQDDELADAIIEYVQSNFEWSKRPDLRDRLQKLIRKCPPFSRTLYRAEKPYEGGSPENGQRGFRSWTLAHDTAVYLGNHMVGRDFVVRTTGGAPVKALSIDDFHYWHGRIHGYAGSGTAQAEFLVLDSSVPKRVWKTDVRWQKMASNNEDATGQCHCTVCGTEIAEGMVCTECAKTCQKCGGPTRNCKCASFVHAKDALCHDCWGKSKTAALTKEDIQGRRRALEAFFPAELVQAAIDEAPDGETYTMPLDEALDEHERLIQVLKSPDHTDDLQEAKEQEAELRKMKAAGSVTVGFNVNDSEMPWTELILSGKKTIETRDSDSLRPHVGERIGIVRTGGRGPAALVGYCTLPTSKAASTKLLYWGGRPGATHLVPKNTEHRAGIWLTDSIKVAASFGTEIYRVEVTGLNNPLVVDAQGEFYSEIPTPQILKDEGVTFRDTCTTDNIVAYALTKGYDSVIIQNVTEGFSGGGVGLSHQTGTDYVLLKEGQARIVSSFDYKSTLDVWGMPKDPKLASAPTVGVNINDSEHPWTQMILQGKKTIETRNSDSLRPHVGERVGIVRTGQGPATLVGYCTLGEPKVYRTNEEFRADNASHRIPDGPQWDLQPGAVKFGYPLADVEACEPKRVEGQGRVFRRIAAPLGDAAWQHILSRFPKEFQAEVLAERSGKSLEDIQELQNWRLTSRAPVVIPLNAAFIQQQCEALHLPAEVVQRINEMWGLGLRPSGQVYDPNPERYFRYAQMPAATANPSIMLGPDIVWGVGRFVAACLRGDRSLRVWKLRQGKSASFLTFNKPSDVWRQKAASASEPYPIAGATVDGLTVGSKIPNQGSIAASLEDYEVLKGVRVLSMSSFDADPADMFPAANDRSRVRALAEQIKVNGYIDPLIVVVDADGPYVLEGAHRLCALFTLGKTEFPALVVLDGDGGPGGGKESSLKTAAYSKAWIAPGPLTDASFVDVDREHAFTASDICDAHGISPAPGATPERECEIPLLQRGWIRAGFKHDHSYFEVGKMTQATLETLQAVIQEDPTGDITVEDGAKNAWECSAQEFLAINRVGDLRHYKHHGFLVRGAASTVLYHGTRSTVDTPKPSKTPHKILWATEDKQVADNYANTSFRKEGEPVVWEITLKPGVQIVDFKDVDHPVVRSIKEAFSTERRYTMGYAVSDEKWVRDFADFGVLEAYPWITKRLKALGVYALRVKDISHMLHGDKVESVAILADKAIASARVVKEAKVASGTFPGFDFAAKPWRMTEEEFKANPPHGFIYKERGHGTEVASATPEGIILTSRFWGLPNDDIRYSVVMHELGHYMSDYMLNDGSAFDTWDEMRQHFRIPHVNGQTTPGEVWAELYSIYMDDPADLNWQGWDGLRPLVESKVQEYGFPKHGEIPK